MYFDFLSKSGVKSVHKSTLDNLDPVDEWSSIFGTLFDPDHYRDQVDAGSDLGPAEALEHFLAVGWELGLDPSEEFSTNGYLLMNPDVEAAGLNPLRHYFYTGISEGREAVPTSSLAQLQRSIEEREAVAAAMEELRVDLWRYLNSLGFEVACADLLFPYEMSDRDGADPEWFDADFYLDRNHDVRASGLDPLAHFMHGGFRENRLPVPQRVSFRFQPLADVDRVLVAKARRTISDSALHEPSLTGVEVVGRFRDAGFECNDEIVIAFGHDDYGTCLGGIQLCAGFEQQQFALSGATYAYIFPMESRTSLRSGDSHEGLVGCRVNGILVPGSFRLLEFVDALSEASPDGPVVAGIVNHSMLGHEPERVAEAIGRLSPRKLVWWVHDYSAHCVNYLLLRNGVDSCGDPQLESQSCSVCSFGPERAEHVGRLRKLMDAFDWEVCTPSAAAAEVSMAGSNPLPKRPIVVPHGRLVETEIANPPIVSKERVRIAFVGHPSFHKGWETFLEFSNSSSAELFEFFHFGVDDQAYPQIEFVKLEQQAGNFGVATDLLVEHGIEAVLNWPRWKETFNFVNYESLAAGCLVITNPGAGHVVDAARELDRAIVFDSVEKLVSETGLAERIRSHHLEVPRQVLAFEMTGLSSAIIAVTSPKVGGPG